MIILATLFMPSRPVGESSYLFIHLSFYVFDRKQNVMYTEKHRWYSDENNWV